ncbi:hypothetical protein U8P73_36025 (plasmid) [Rhizobium beringeri]|uniref:hypothetical protein n=1 Tax=Rhizobium beringeri TaxID=3019934 RepID=UPI002DDCB542|nr:hypothetical protein [Rhizobium beringeri]WSG93559.1 hypothetical protein U8P73_36025 [Rhizobium beringeri]
MKSLVYAAVAIALVSSGAGAQELSPQRKLQNIFRDFLIARDCAEYQRRFSASEMQELTHSVKDYAEQSGISHDDRDGLFNRAMQEQQDVIEYVAGRRDELCVETRGKLAETFPSAFKTSENPF